MNIQPGEPERKWIQIPGVFYEIIDDNESKATENDEKHDNDIDMFHYIYSLRSLDSLWKSFCQQTLKHNKTIQGRNDAFSYYRLL